MVYFLEHDDDGAIFHVACYPEATIVPLINVIRVTNGDGTAKVLAEPVGIEAATYTSLITDGLDKYTFNPSTNSITKKGSTDGD